VRRENNSFSEWSGSEVEVVNNQAPVSTPEGLGLAWHRHRSSTTDNWNKQF